MTDVEPLSPLNPPGYEQTEFVKPNLPSVPFMLSGDLDAAGSMAGPYRGDEWGFDPISNIGFHQPLDGNTEYLRVLVQDNNELLTVDGDGEEHDQTIVVIPDNTMPLDGTDAGSLTDAQRSVISNVTGAQT